MAETKEDGPKVNCEKCKHFQEPKYDLKKFKYTQAKCLKGMKLYYVAPSSMIAKPDTWGFMRMCNKFEEK